MIIQFSLAVFDDLLREHVGHSQGLGAQVPPVGLIGRHDVLHALCMEEKSLLIINKIMVEIKDIRCYRRMSSPLMDWIPPFAPSARARQSARPRGRFENPQAIQAVRPADIFPEFSNFQATQAGNRFPEDFPPN